MTVHILTIPDDPHQWGDWLEQQLASPNFGELIQELQLAFAGEGGEQPLPLGQIFTESQLRSVTRTGFADTSLHQIQQLLASPDALLKLQENILLNQTTFWKSRFVEDEQSSQSIARVRDRVLKPTPGNVRPLSTAEPTQKAPRISGLRWAVGLALTLMLSFAAWQFLPGSDSSTGVLGEAQLTANNVDSTADYFKRIATSGEKWFSQPRDDTEQLQALLKTVSANCQRLIDAEHEALSATERQWFVDKCRNWKTKLDQVVVDLQNGVKTYEEARRDSDAIMTRLVEVLQAGPLA